MKVIQDSRNLWAHVLGDSKATMVLLLVLMIFNVITSLIPVIVLEKFIDTIINNPNPNPYYIFTIFMIMMVSFLGEQMSNAIFQFKFSKLLIKNVTLIKKMAFRKITNLSYLTFRNIESDLYNVFIKDMNSLINGGFEMIPNILISVLIAIGASFYLIRINTIFFIGIVVISLIGLVPLNLLNKRQDKLIADYQLDEQDHIKFLNSYFENPSFIKGNYNIKYVINKYKEIANKLLKSTLKKELNFRILLTSLIVADALLPTFIYGYGSKMYFNNEITIGQIVVCIGLVRFVSNPIKNLFSYSIQIKEIIPRIKRINEVFDLDEEVKLSSKCLPIKNEYEIEFKNVCLEIDDKSVLNNISFKISTDKNYMIVGKSGIGKTSLFRLMLKIYSPTKGDILINNDTINSIDSVKMRSLFAYVPQVAFFFKGTIRDNLVVGLGEITDEQLSEALYMSCSNEFVDTLENGLNTIVDEGASNFSGGQRQRLSLARAILKKRKVFLLDEATSNLSYELESELLKRLSTGLNATIIQISHRMNGLEYCDKLLEISKEGVNIVNSDEWSVSSNLA